jgi:YebC/PmpR family DNA-binding regulatory protein
VDDPGAKADVIESGVDFPFVFWSFCMSGHSKWHTIKHKKGAADAKRGKIFTRIIKELTVAARNGGGDQATNPRLRTIIAEAKANNMPRENIERAIRRGTGEEPGVSYEEITYEGYGPGGAALLIQSLTDNKNRTVGEIRHLLAKWNGNLAAENSVAWMFSRKGQVVVEKSKADEEKLLNAALEAGADDMNDDGSAWEIVSAPESFETVRDAVKALGVEPASAEVAMIPQNYVKLEGKDAQQMLKLMEALDDHDDVQHVWANFDISEKEIEASLA